MSIIVNDLLKNYYKNIDVETKLDLDIAIRQLKNANQLDYEELKIIKLLKKQFTNIELAHEMCCSSRTINRKKKVVCEKISKQLGTDYQDLKILLQVQRKLGRNLSDDEKMFCWLIINKSGFFDRKVTIFNFRERVGINGNGRGNQKERQMGL